LDICTEIKEIIMKKLIISIVFLIVGLSINTNANTDYAKRVGGYFYTSLSPYGTWIEIGFGTPVWRPTIIRKTWSPYNNGQWIYTDYGWYWDSYEPFGAIVYHYGRWYYDDYYGWIWIPDNEWAPAWVEWRYDDDYIGWAPLSPYALFSVSIGIHYTHNYNIPYSYWNFVKYNHFCDRNVYRYFAAPKYKYRIYGQTKIRNNYSYYDGRVRNGGVDYDRIRERSGRSISKRNLVTVNDLSEISKTRNSNDREIRTYIARREDLSRDGLRDIKVERTDRKTSLDLSKVELGRERTQPRTTERNDVKSRERNLDNNSRKNDQNLNRDTRKDNNNRINEEKKVQPRNEVKRNSEIQKRNNDVNIQKRNETKKIESRNQNYESRNRNSELKRNESNTRRENRKNESSDSREKIRR
jgi:hypothetical protein